MLSAWDAADADCHRDEASLLSLSPLALLPGLGTAAAAAGSLLPPPAAPPAVSVDARTGLATVSFSVREGADELGVLLALAELVQALSSSSGCNDNKAAAVAAAAAAPAVSVVPLRREGARGRGLRLSAGDAAATFLSSSAAAAGTSSSPPSPAAASVVAPPKVELTVPASTLVAVQQGELKQPKDQQPKQQQQHSSSSSSSSPLEKLFRASNSVVSSFGEGEEGEVGEDGRPRLRRRRSFARSWTWHSGGESNGGGNGEGRESSSSSLRGDLAGPLFRSVDEVFRQSLEELFGPLEGGAGGKEGGGGGGVRLEGRPPVSPAPPPTPPPSSPGSPPHRRPPAPRPAVPRGGSARAASAIAALEDLGCSVFLPPPKAPPRPRRAAAANEAGAAIEAAEEVEAETEADNDPWSGLAAYERQKEEVRLALLPLTHGEVVSGVAEAARRGGPPGGGGSGASSSPAAAAALASAAPRAVLFEGPPGCGKTSSARAAARLAGVPLVVAPLESIVSKWYGEAEQRLAAVFRHSRELAAAAAASAASAAAAAAAEASSSPPRSSSSSPSSAGGVLLFIDEVDALATSRGEGGMHEATRRVLGTLLRELDGLRESTSRRRKGSRRGRGGEEEAEDDDFEERPSTSTGNVVAVLSTNRPGDIDAALASRCAARVFFPLPDAADRAAVLGLHARHLSPEQLAALASEEASGGLSPRDLVDATAAAERSWASRVVSGEAEPGTAPPFAEYKRAVEERAGRRW